MMTTWTPAVRTAVGLGSLLAATSLLGGCGLLGSGPERNDDGRVTETVEAGVLELRTGDCFTDDGGTEVTLVPCEKPHEYEVFAATELPAGDYPGEDQAKEAAVSFCQPAFEDFVGLPYSDSELPLQYFYPKVEDWSEAGNRAVLCLVAEAGDKQATGSLQDSAR